MNDFLLKIEDIANAIINLFFAILPYLQIISIILIVVLGYFIFQFARKKNVLISKIEKNLEKYMLIDPARYKLQKSWRAIVAAVNSKDEQKTKDAIGDADKILAEVLKLKGFKGTDTNERLFSIEVEELENIKDLIREHKIAERIKNDPEFQIPYQEAKEILKTYQKSFKDLGII